MNILLVDDHQENLYMLEVLFRGSGHNAHSALNGVEALDILASRDIDLIISDILMPVMDGFQFCRKVKTDEKYRNIPFIIYTATYTGPQDEAFARKIGADCFILKPCEPDVLMLKVDELIRHYAERGGKSQLESVAEEEVFKLYSERLVRKLEQKMLEAERELQTRQIAEKELRISRERLIAAQRIAKMGDFTWNVSTGGVILSDAMYELLGYSPLETIDYSRMSDEVYHPDDRAAISQWLQKRMNSCETGSGPREFRFIRKGGETIHIQAFISIKYENGSAVEIFITVQDITERKLAEEEHEKLHRQLVQAQRLESIGRLAGGVAHDFNNMLSIILGYGESLLEELQPGNPIWDGVNEIVEAGKRSAALTRQLLAFSRKQPLQPEVLDLNGLVRNLEKMLKRIIGEDIELKMLLAEDLANITADPGQIEQILLNLTVNSRDAMASGGKLTIETANAVLDENSSLMPADATSGKYVLLTVSDTGCGMSKDVISQIFEPFFTTKENGKGTGLGLSTVYGIVKQSGGQIAVDSVQNKGTIFKIYFPQSEKKIKAVSHASAEKSAKSSGRGERILVVEDECSVRNLIKMLLERIGYEVTTADNGLEALSMVKSGRVKPDLVITDMIMPHISGTMLAERLRKIQPGIGILYVSGYTPNLINGQVMSEPDTAFISKPFTVQDMAEKVRAMVSVRKK